MADEQEKPFAVERAKTGRAKCKMCKCPIEKDVLRIAKLVSNPFGDGKLKAWHHLTCLFQVFARQRATTKRIDDPETDIEGWDRLTAEDQKMIDEKVQEFENSSPFGQLNKEATKKRTRTREASSQESKKPRRTAKLDASSSKATDQSQDDLFREFRRVCMNVASVDAYTEKTAIVRRMLTKGTSGDGFKGDLKLWCKLLLPSIVQRVYNLRSKQLIKLFSRILLQDEDEMLEHLELGDVAETIRVFFEKSVAICPARKSLLTVQEVEDFLERLSYLTKEEEQMQHFRSIMPRCTGNDLQMIIREIKRDLRINAGPKHILNAVHEDAYSAFQTSRDLNAVIDRCTGKSSISSSPDRSSSSSFSDLNASKIGLCLMTPVQPMLAEACKSVEMAMKKCPNGMLSEVKYDGERVQVHKRGSEFRYYSRSLKPVLPHKVRLFEQYIPQAFPGGDDLILDSEILMIDRNTGQPLPFGTLGIHKEAQFKDANVCLFVFDCIYYNGEVLMNKPMLQRRKILEERMIQIPNRIMLSEVQQVHKPRDLAEMIANVLKMGQEGLVLKDTTGVYEPGKRHWLKVKKDYLYGGAMADSADLVVLGAWYGTGNKGGMMSVFLMGCHDQQRDVWLTVCKVHTGHDDATLALLQDELEMVKIAKDPGKLPSWLRAEKRMVPDFVAKDPKKQPVWEISGAEFTNQGVHTAEGISIRFPRVTRIRKDKDWSTATNLDELRRLFEKSSESLDFSRLLAEHSEEQAEESAKPGTLDTFVKKEPKPGTLDTFVKKEPKITGTLDIFVKKEPKEEIVPEAGPSFVKIEPDPETPRVKREKKTETTQKIKLEATVKEENCEKKKKRRTRSAKKDRDNLHVNIKKEQKENEDRETEEDTKKKKKKAEYYAFIGNDYIEYTRDGSPVNWVECRKPARGLPADARPLSSLTVDELNSRAVFKDVRATLADSFDWAKREEVWRTLRTLGAVVLEDQDRSRATHVIHATKEIPSTKLQEFQDFPRTVRHVNVGWVERSADESECQDTEIHAVEIAASYCNCPCKHQ